MTKIHGLVRMRDDEQEITGMHANVGSGVADGGQVPGGRPVSDFVTRSHTHHVDVELRLLAVGTVPGQSIE